eukprot:3102155-Pyramimonas_sp.AAC.2
MAVMDSIITNSRRYNCTRDLGCRADVVKSQVGKIRERTGGCPFVPSSNCESISKILLNPSNEWCTGYGWTPIFCAGFGLLSGIACG